MEDNKLDDVFLDDVTGGMSEKSMEVLESRLNRGVGGSVGSKDAGSSLKAVMCPGCMKKINVKDDKNYTCMLCGKVVVDGVGQAL